MTKNNIDKKKLKKRSKGFTVVEIVLVLGLIVLLSTLTFFSFNTLNNKQSLDKQINFIKSSINKTRMNALNSKDGQDQSISFSSTSIKYDNQIFDLQNNIILDSYISSTNTITFYRLTGFPSATGTFVYKIKGDDNTLATSSIIINNLGIIE